MLPSETAQTPLRRSLVALAYGVSALVGIVAGYGFGHRIGGPLIGVVVSLNAAVFCSILVGAAAERMCGRATPGPR
jgi:hypothetical protein